jgi:hypothetical protein
VTSRAIEFFNDLPDKIDVIALTANENRSAVRKGKQQHAIQWIAINKKSSGPAVLQLIAV